MRFLLFVLVVGGLAVSVLPAANAVKVTDPKDKQILDGFLRHAGNVLEEVSAEKCRKSNPENFAWVLLPNLNMTLTAYRMTGDANYLDLFVKGFANMQAALTKTPDGFRAWYGAASPTYVNPRDPNGRGAHDAIHSDFRAAELLSQFALLAAADPALARKYEKQRAEYLDLAENQLVKKWDVRGNYVDLGAGGGVYRIEGSAAAETADLTLPHNKHAILVAGLLDLYQATGKDEYMRRAVQLGTRFKHSLTLKDGHYEWDYWDPAGAWDVHPQKKGQWKHWIGPEHNSGYYSSTLAQAVSLYHYGLVFDKTDIDRFVKTQMEMCWNGDIDSAKWYRVDHTNPAQYTKGEYIAASLAPFQAKVHEYFYGPHGQDARLKGMGNSWQAGPVAVGWIEGKFLTGPAAKDGKPMHADIGAQFLAKGANQEFMKGLRFEVTRSGYTPPKTPADMNPMPPAPKK